MNSLDIPDKYAEYAEAIRATIKETIKIKLKQESNLKPWQSKVGGLPYLPLSESYPVDSKGNPLLFLAQVNFREVPHIEGYPEKGIVQFYIDVQDDLMGLQSNEHKVLYYAYVEKVESNLHDTITKFNFPYTPLENDNTFSMEFSLEKQYISTNDYRFENFAAFGDNYDMVYEYEDLYPPDGHRIGGYPMFAQSDPREDSNELKDYELLFQLGSDENIAWGDRGVGGFFIKPEDLQKLDFSKVLYYWDCY